MATNKDIKADTSEDVTPDELSDINRKAAEAGAAATTAEGKAAARNKSE